MFSADDLESQAFFRLDRLPTRARRHTTPSYGDARLATEPDLRRFLNRPDEEHPARLDDVSLLTEASAGGRYAPIWKTPLFLGAEARRQNILAVGPIGCGKTSELILPLAKSDIEDPEASIVVVDIKGDLHQKLAPFVERFRPGAAIAVLNLTDPDRTTHGWNPFAHQEDEGTALDNAEIFCQAAQSLRARWDSPFWDGNAARWIAALSLCLKKAHDAVCPADVHRALELPRNDLLDLLAAHPDIAFAPGGHETGRCDGHGRRADAGEAS